MSLDRQIIKKGNTGALSLVLPCEITKQGNELGEVVHEIL